MPRNFFIKKNLLKKDPFYNSYLVSLLITNVLKEGKKCLAASLVYKALVFLKKRKKNVLNMLEQAINNIRPKLKLKELSRKKGARTIITSLEFFKSIHYAIKWLLKSAIQRSKKSFSINLGNEIYDAYLKRGLTFRKKNEFHHSILIKRTGL